MTLTKFPALKFPRVSQYVIGEGGKPQQTLRKEDGTNIAKLANIKQFEAMGFEGQLSCKNFSGDKTLTEQMDLPWNQKRLQRIKIALPECAGITQEQVNEIADLIRKHANSLTSLELNFSDISKTSRVTLKPIFDEIKNTHQLENLGINLAKSDFVDDDKEIANIAKALRYLNKLRSLDVNLSKIPAAYRLSLKPIFEALKSMPNLEGLRANLANSNFIRDNNAVNDIAKSFAKLNKLRSLDLDFTNIASSDLISLASMFSSLKMMPLEHFNINLAGTRRDDVALVEIAAALKNKKNLRSFGVNLAMSYGASASSLMPMLGYLKTANPISHLALNLNNTTFSGNDAVLVGLGEVLRRQTELLSLQIGVAGNYFSSDVFNDFINKLPYLGKLENLVLNVHSSRGLSVKAGFDEVPLKELWCNLEQLKSLHAMSLNIGGNDSLDDNSIFRAGSMIKNLEELREINLHISDTQCTAQSVKTLTGSLRAEQLLRLYALGCRMKRDEVRTILGNFEMDHKARAEIYLRKSDYEKPVIPQK